MAAFIAAVSQTVEFIQNAVTSGALIGDELHARLTSELSQILALLRQAGTLTLSEATEASAFRARNL